MKTLLRFTPPTLMAILLTSASIEARSSISIGLIRLQPPVRQITAGSDPREVLTKAWAAMDTVKSFRIRIERPAAGPDHTYVTEFVSPDRYHTTRKNWEAISIGDEHYVKKGDEPWVKVGRRIDGSNNNASIVLKLHKHNRADIMKLARDVKLIGADAIDGVESLLYEYDLYDRYKDILIMKLKVWVGIADGLLRKAECQFQMRSSKATTIDTYYDYNADIKIEPPAVKETQDSKEGEIRTGLGSGRGYNMGGGVPSPGNLNPDGSAKTVDARPVLLNRPQPLYTEEARKNKVQGTVRVRILVGGDGRVKRASIITGLPDGLNEMALQAAHRMQFKPAMKDGQPIAYWLNNVLFKFRIDK